MITSNENFNGYPIFNGPYIPWNEFDRGLKISQNNWHGKRVKMIEFMCWVGKNAGEFGDCDDQTVAIFRIKSVTK